jgi:A/G-specific adenine glycosylase
VAVSGPEPGEHAGTVPPGSAHAALLHERVLDWYADHGRDLPWRDPGCSAWGVLVSEVMSHQTPIARVLPVWHEWMERWPTPADLAAQSPGEVVRAWGRLGYPRRALRLHEAAAAIVVRHGGEVPADEDDLRALPGVGDYTAAAVAAFAFGRRATVVDTNVRRVLARAVEGRALAAPALTAAEARLAASLVPRDAARSAAWNVAVMELGALVCRARGPRCGDCPLRDACAWVAAGSPPHPGPQRRGQAWDGTDRQVRGRVLQALRESDGPLTRPVLEALGEDPHQVDRCLASLVEDGLLEPAPDGRFALPS